MASMSPFRSYARAVLAAVLIGLASGAFAAESYPLRPPDTSSPRATLQGFIAAMDDDYRVMSGVMESYVDSNQLYLSAEERRAQMSTFASVIQARQYLDLSGLAPVLRDTAAIERVIQLKEILDRISLPSFADIPDQEAMARMSSKRWRLPNTEIDIALIPSGPRAGEYLVTAGTVERLPDFYWRIRKLPYNPGPGQQLDGIYRRLTHNGSATLYDAYENSPIGLSFIIPPRWMLGLPDWARVRVADTATWQWFGLAIGFFIGGSAIWLTHLVARRQPNADEVARGPHWRALLLPLVIMFVAGLVTPFLDGVLRVGGDVRVIIEYTRTVVTFLSAAWLAIVAFVILGEAIAGVEHLAIRSLDSQLVRLGSRLIGVVVAAAILIHGGDELGFPAYSVLAGLGVGGLAVALAAQSTIANLIASLLLVLEKPFRIGQYVRIGASEGTVIDVGFRSTRIRTPDNTILSIPSSSVVNAAVENLSVRTAHRQELLVHVAYDTSRQQLEGLVSSIERVLADSPLVDKSGCEVGVNNFDESALTVLVIFYLLVPDRGTELSTRQAILLRILDVVKESGTRFTA